jgi:hypothetical protein
MFRERWQSVNLCVDNNTIRELPFKCNIAEEGREAFMQWLNSDDKKSIDNPIFLKQFINGNQALLHDTFLNKDIIVEIRSGAPMCKNCNLDDCAHIGFAICIQQLYNCDGEKNRCEV